MAGREQKGRGRSGRLQHLNQRRARGRVRHQLALTKPELFRDGRLGARGAVSGRAVDHRAQQPVRAENRGIVEGVPRPPEHGLARVSDGCCRLVFDHAGGVACELRRRVEIEETHAVVRIDFVGDLERQTVG
jgi:hypothetical protein